MGRRILTAVVTSAVLSMAACGGSTAPEGGDYDPGVAEEFVADKVIADVQADVALATTDVEVPEVNCKQARPSGQEATDTGLFDCAATVEDRDGETVARERWDVGVEIDPQTNGGVVRSAERVSSSIGEAPEPTG